MSKYIVKNVEAFNDALGAGWLIFTIYLDGVLGTTYKAISASYEPSKYPLITNKSWNGVHDDIETYAKNHKEDRVPEAWFRDQNNVDWIVVYDKGLIRDDYTAATRAYNGAMIATTSEGDLHAEIFLFADQNKGLVVTPDPPKPPPPPSPPVVDPKDPKPPIVDPKVPQPPANKTDDGIGAGTILFAGGALAAILYFVHRNS